MWKKESHLRAGTTIQKPERCCCMNIAWKLHDHSAFHRPWFLPKVDPDWFSSFMTFSHAYVDPCLCLSKCIHGADSYHIELRLGRSHVIRCSCGSCSRIAANSLCLTSHTYTVYVLDFVQADDTSLDVSECLNWGIRRGKAAQGFAIPQLLPLNHFMKNFDRWRTFRPKASKKLCSSVLSKIVKLDWLDSPEKQSWSHLAPRPWSWSAPRELVAVRELGKRLANPQVEHGTTWKTFNCLATLWDA